MSNFQAKNPKKQEEILKKISESWVFASGLFVRALWSEKNWPLHSCEFVFIFDYREEVKGVDATQDLNLHPINAVPEYCRLWPALPNVGEELMQIAKEYL